MPSGVLAEAPARRGARPTRVARALASPDLLGALQAEVPRLKKRGVKVPFVRVDLRKWAPARARAEPTDADSASEVSQEIRDLAKVQRGARGLAASGPCRRPGKWRA